MDINDQDFDGSTYNNVADGLKTLAEFNETVNETVIKNDLNPFLPKAVLLTCHPPT